MRHVIQRSGARPELASNRHERCLYLVLGIVVAESMLDGPDEEGVSLSVSITNAGTLIGKLCVQWLA